MTNNSPIDNQFIAASIWILPSGQRVGWCFNLTTNELEDCWIPYTVNGGFKDDDEQTRRLFVTRPAPLVIREAVIADLKRVDIQDNWRNFKHIYEALWI